MSHRAYWSNTSPHTEIVCSTCYQKGHYASLCPNKASTSAHGARNSAKSASLKCSFCLGRDHMTKECKNSTMWYCRNCECLGHLYQHCTKPQRHSPKKRRFSTLAQCTKCGAYHEKNAKACSASKPCPRTSMNTPSSSESGALKLLQPDTKMPVPSSFALASIFLADEHFRLKHWSKAIAYYSKAIQVESRIGGLYAKRGIAYTHLGRYQDAHSDFGSALKDQFYKPTFEFHIRRSRCCLHLGYLAAAIHACRGAKQLDPYHSEVYALRVLLDDLLRTRERYEETSAEEKWAAAKATYETCLKIYQKEGCRIPVEVQRWGIELKIADGTRLDEAEREICEFLEQSQPSEMLYLLALVHFLRNNLAECLSQLRKILISDPDYPEAQRLRACVKRIVACKANADALVQSKHWDKAHGELTAALEAIEPYKNRANGGLLRASLFKSRASVCKEWGQSEQAIKDLAVCLSIIPEDFLAILLRARVYIDLELYDRAVPDLALASERAPRHLKAAIQRELEQTERKKLSCPRDFYKMLGLEPSCTRAQIKRAYHAASRKNHPDKGGLQELFGAISEAYETLFDESKRANYDRIYYSKFGP